MTAIAPHPVPKGDGLSPVCVSSGANLSADRAADRRQDLLLMIRYYYRHADGAIMKRFCKDKLICYCIERFAKPCIGYRIVFERRKGYCIESDLLLGCIEISKEAFLSQLSRCAAIYKPSLVYPLPRWFHMPTPSLRDVP